MSEDDHHILLAHGSGGILSHELVRDLFAHYFDNPFLRPMADAALLGHLPPGQLALTTDSYVVHPIEFPGGDIGKLAVCGTVNDLAVVGAEPLYLTAGFILEEGLTMETLERVVASMATTAREAGVEIVTGDTKVVERGAADGLFINTAGLGIVPVGRHLGTEHLRPGDRLLVNGTMGDHGIAVMIKREGLAFESKLQSDCAPLNDLVTTLMEALPDGTVRCLRDATRGGLVTVLNEWAESGVGIEIEEEAVPVREEVRAVSELLGLDPLYAANEGKIVVAVAQEVAEIALATLRAHSLGREASIIGQVTGEHAGRVALRTPYGVRRIVQMLTGAPLPRIC